MCLLVTQVCHTGQFVKQRGLHVTQRGLHLL